EPGRTTPEAESVERLSESAPRRRRVVPVQKRGSPCASLLVYHGPARSGPPFRRSPAPPTGAIVNDVLVLNFTYEALNIASFQRAVKLLFSGRPRSSTAATPSSSRRRTRCGCPRSFACSTTSS